MTEPVQHNPTPGDPHANTHAEGSPTRPVESPNRRKVVRRAWVITLVVAVLLALGAGRTVMSRIDNSKSLQAGTVERAKQYVKVTTPKTTASGESLALPGTLQGQVQSPISARASGYLKRWYKDIGARVNKGDLLAEIETPEIDQQLSQAMAARDQAAQSLGLAKSTMERWEALRKKDAVSQQELDERRSNEGQARSNLAAAEANVERLRQTGGFKRVVAPYSGVITKRNVDTGDLIDAGANRPLFQLAQTDSLRVYINVPQTYAHLVKAGQKVTITQGELRGQQFTGVVERTSGSIDPATRTLQVEISLANKDNVLLPGAYVQVVLPLAANEAMTISANTLMFRGEGIRVAIVDAQGKVRLSPVKVGRNLGESVEVVDGIKAGDKVVLNPSDSLTEGDQVSIAPTAAAAPPKASSNATSNAPANGSPPTGAAPAKQGPDSMEGSPAAPTPGKKDTAKDSLIDQKTALNDGLRLAVSLGSMPRTPVSPTSSTSSAPASSQPIQALADAQGAAFPAR